VTEKDDRKYLDHLVSKASKPNSPRWGALLSWLALLMILVILLVSIFAVLGVPGQHIAIIAIVGGVLLMYLFITAGFLLWGASLAGIEEPTFGKALHTCILGGLAGTILSVALLALGFSPALGSLGQFLVHLVVMGPTFSTTLGKAFIATVFSYLLSIVAMIVIFMVLAPILVSLS
ncbi:MAG: hypothetical protein N2C14_04700, partial [Planctomycetales bacterium]